ncbi:MAG: hypothetical protein ACREBH_00780 [Candidatus Micrarchaeaceae archaeon]
MANTQSEMSSQLIRAFEKDYSMDPAGLRRQTDMLSFPNCNIPPEIVERLSQSNFVTIRHIVATMADMRYIGTLRKLAYSDEEKCVRETASYSLKALLRSSIGVKTINKSL